MIVAVSMMRDEADICAQTVRQLYEQGVDLVVVADNLSSDGTADLCRDAGADVLTDPDPAYWQADKMTRLARHAYDTGAEWVVPFDADEWWYAPGSTIAAALPECGVHVVYANGYDHLPEPDAVGDPIVTMTRRRAYPQPFPKVAFRAHPTARLAQGNHDVDHPGGTSRRGILEFRHYQWRTFDQFVRKARQGLAAYQATTLPETEGAHWRHYGAMTDAQLADEWARMCAEPGVIDPAP